MIPCIDLYTLLPMFNRNQLCNINHIQLFPQLLHAHTTTTSRYIPPLFHTASRALAFVSRIIHGDLLSQSINSDNNSMSSSTIAHSNPIISSKLTDVSHLTFTALIRVKNQVSILLNNNYHHLLLYVQSIHFTPFRSKLTQQDSPCYARHLKIWVMSLCSLKTRYNWGQHGKNGSSELQNVCFDSFGKSGLRPMYQRCVYILIQSKDQATRINEKILTTIDLNF